MKFTTDLPPEDPFGTEPNYIVIHPNRGEIWAPQSSRQILSERYGWAARGGYLWAKIEPGMVQGLLGAQTGTPDQSRRIHELEAALVLAVKRMHDEAVTLASFAGELDGVMGAKE